MQERGREVIGNELMVTFLLGFYRNRYGNGGYSDERTDWNACSDTRRQLSCRRRPLDKRSQPCKGSGHGAARNSCCPRQRRAAGALGQGGMRHRRPGTEESGVRDRRRVRQRAHELSPLWRMGRAAVHAAR